VVGPELDKKFPKLSREKPSDAVELRGAGGAITPDSMGAISTLAAENRLNHGREGTPARRPGRVTSR